MSLAAMACCSAIVVGLMFLVQELFGTDVLLIGSAVFVVAWTVAWSCVDEIKRDDGGGRK